MILAMILTAFVFAGMGFVGIVLNVVLFPRMWKS